MEQEERVKIFNEKFAGGELTWWVMELPSGRVYFGDAKAKMLGYPEEQFKTYHDFTRLLHPEDYEKTMQVMRDHLEGRAEIYQTVYRIKASNGEYISFFDYGRVAKREGNEISLFGFVVKIKEQNDLEKEVAEFKEMFGGESETLLSLFQSVVGK